MSTASLTQVLGAATDRWSTVFLYPGQGSQQVGMGAALWESFPLAREMFARADETLGISLSSICFCGPEEVLTRTENAQPALYVVSAIMTALLRECGVEPRAAAGHSIGEYAAHHAAGTFSFEEGLRIVRSRGELMAERAERVRGTMAAVIGLDLNEVEGLCEASAAAGYVTVANENGPSETVVSGEARAMEALMDLVDSTHVGIAVPLDVSGAFHCDLMEPVKTALGRKLREARISVPRLPVLANVSAEPIETVEAVIDSLTRQVSARVLWDASLSRIAAAGPERVIEVGPGRVLSRLAARRMPVVTFLGAEEVLLGPGSARGASVTCPVG